MTANALAEMRARSAPLREYEGTLIPREVIGLEDDGDDLFRLTDIRSGEERLASQDRFGVFSPHAYALGDAHVALVTDDPRCYAPELRAVTGLVVPRELLKHIRESNIAVASLASPRVASLSAGSYFGPDRDGNSGGFTLRDGDRNTPDRWRPSPASKAVPFADYQRWAVDGLVQTGGLAGCSRTITVSEPQLRAHFPALLLSGVVDQFIARKELVSRTSERLAKWGAFA